MTYLKNIVLTVVIFASFFAFDSCSPKGNEKGVDKAFVVKKFPELPKAPAAYSDPEEASKYVLSHYWDKFIADYKDYPTDSTMLCGVKNDDVEYALGTFVTLLENNLSVKDAQQCIKAFFDEIEAVEAEDASSSVFEKLVEYTSKYLYDPNSPVRNEDIYLPFVKRLAESKFTNPDLVPAYKFDASMCSLNQVGTKASNFAFKDLNGKVNKLYSVDAEYTLLFFSNPGCPSCQEIIETIDRNAHILDAISAGKLAVVNIYIDQEIDYWKEYASHYPKQWYTGYDYKYQIRTDVSYSVRAIPSLYILDKEKRVIMKDAPQEKVIRYLNSI